MGKKENKKLRDIAYARSGDKGDHANIGIIARSQSEYDFLEKALTKEKVHQYFSPISPTETIRYPIPNLLAFNFILKNVLDGGGSSSLRIDGQGKALGQILLEMPLDNL